MNGFFHRVLEIDVGRRTWQEEALSDETLRLFLGGKGLGTHLLLTHNPPGVDPLSPNNRLILALGPATDTPLPGSCRYGVFTKSPLTGLYGESYAGGRVASPMSRAGYDAVIVTGCSADPVWLEIGEGGVVFHDAGDLWGLETYTAEDAVRAALGPIESGVLVIGPAGENRVRFAVIENDRWRSAGRCGMGAVLGSKRVKALAFHGRQKRPVADPKGLSAYARRIMRTFSRHPSTEAYRSMGTPMMVAVLNNAGAFPTAYWSKGRFDRWEEISAQRLKERCRVRPRACRTCFVACGNMTEVLSGRHQGLKLEGPEYETIYAFGGLCLIDSIEEIVHLNDLCDRLGLDTMTAGNLIGLVMEASKRGRLSERLAYGDAEQAAVWLGRIARREGIGDLLAEGIRPAAEALSLADLAVHVKGLEPAGYDPRALKGMGLAYAVSDRGACHLRTTFYKAELSGLIDSEQVEGKAELFLDFEDRCTLFDALVACRFYRDFYTWDELAEIVALTTGQRLDKAGLQALAGRITDSARRFNLREGMTSDQDRLPERLFRESLEDGRSLSRADQETLIKDYYRLRGWGREGMMNDE